MKYSIGIDLGTTNCIVAYTELGEGKSQGAEIRLLDIPQIIAPNQVETRQSLPSFLYVPTLQEKESAAFDIPDAPQYPTVNGFYARENSPENPTRTISASKSWLCHAGSDRHAAILPWDGGENEKPDHAKFSPVAAARLLLRQLTDSWNAQFPDAPIDQQVVTLTVPASFDMSARELTKEAASGAGLPSDLILLEEPQAAVYNWLLQKGERWRQELKRDDQILVVDVGGGTTDLTMVSIEEQQGNLVLNRVAVGDHLLVGGDNMDLALAHLAASKFAEQGKQLNPWQSISLWHQCRKAKELLLAEDSERDAEKISVLGRGSRLIGGAISVDLKRTDVQNLLVDGFFPFCSRDDLPQSAAQTGLQEIGLPYEQDSAITRHVAAFVKHSKTSENSSENSSLHLLLNGGVFRSATLRDRMLEATQKLSECPTSLLGSKEDLDYAVARGAAYYGMTKHSGGVRIRGGTPRSYYVGIESAGLAIPGVPRPLQAVCVAPFGMEEGTEMTVPGREVGLAVGRPATFRFFSSSTRKNDTVGTTLREWDSEELRETDPMEVCLDSEDDTPDQAFEPVKFLSRISELGMLELWCQSARESSRQWKLELNVREDVTDA